VYLQEQAAKEAAAAAAKEAYAANYKNTEDFQAAQELAAAAAAAVAKSRKVNLPVKSKYTELIIDSCEWCGYQYPESESLSR